MNRSSSAWRAATSTLVAATLFTGACAAQPPPPPTPSPSAVNTALPIPPTTPAATPAPATTPDVAATVQPWPFSTPLVPGTYSTVAAGHRITIDVPAGWSSFENWALTKNDAEPPDGAFLMFHGPVTNVYGDGCRWRTSMLPTPGPTVDDLAEQLSSVEDRQVTDPVEVTVGGHEGKYVQVTAPSDIDFSSCDDGRFMSVKAPRYGLWHTAPRETWDVWILDVEGTRYFINSIYHPATPSDAIEEIRQMIESLEVTPAAS